MGNVQTSHTTAAHASSVDGFTDTGSFIGSSTGLYDCSDEGLGGTKYFMLVKKKFPDLENGFGSVMDNFNFPYNPKYVDEFTLGVDQASIDCNNLTTDIPNELPMYPCSAEGDVEGLKCSKAYNSCLPSALMSCFPDSNTNDRCKCIIPEVNREPANAIARFNRTPQEPSCNSRSWADTNMGNGDHGGLDLLTGAYCDALNGEMSFREIRLQ